MSHAGAQKALATRLVEAIEARGLICWIAPRDIVPGADYGEQIVLGIRRSEHLILLFSEEANASQFCQREVERAVHYRRGILPIRIDGAVPTGPMEFHLSSVQWMDIRGGRNVDSWVDRAIEVLRNPGVPDVPAPSGRKPFRIAGTDARSPREVARALARNWEVGLSRDFRAMVIRWIETEADDRTLALGLQDLERQRVLEEERLSAMLVLLAPEEPPVWQGQVVTLDWARANIGEFRTLRASRVRPVLSNSAHWPSEAVEILESGVEAVERIASERSIDFQRSRAERWLLAEDSQEIDREIARRRAEFPDARSDGVRDLLKRTDLDPHEKILLASVPEEAFRTPKNLRWVEWFQRSKRVALGLVALVAVAAGVWGVLEIRERATAVRFLVTVSGRTPEEMGVASGSIRFRLDGRPVLAPEGPLALRSGRHWIQVDDPRFKPFMREFRIPAARVTDLGSFDLVRGWGEVLVETDPPGATVFAANGKEIGVTPLRLAQVEPGTARYRVSLSPHGTVRIEGTVLDGSVLTLRHRFNSGAGDPSDPGVSKAGNPQESQSPTTADDFRVILDRAEALRSGNDIDAMDRLVRQALEGLERLEGADHPDTLRALGLLVDVLTTKGEYPEAERVGRRTLAGFEKVLGPDHRRTLIAAYDLGAVLSLRGDRAAGTPLLSRALSGLDRALGSDPSGDPELEDLHHRSMEATEMLQRGDAAEAEVRLRRVVERVDKALNSYPIRVIAVRNLSILLNATGRPRDSVQLLRRFGGDFDPNLRYSLICAECLSGNLEESKRLMVRQLAEIPEEGSQALEDEDLAPIRDYIKSLIRLTGAGTDPGKP